MGAAEKILHSLEAYLMLEEQSGLKYEYEDGLIIDMAGGTIVHAKVSANIGGIFYATFADGGCDVYTSDAKVFVDEANAYYYPDVTVVCGPPELAHGQCITNPKLLVEVMSDSSAMRDRVSKFRAYRALPSLRQYVLVALHAPIIETYYRNDQGEWVFSDAVGIDKSIQLHAISAEIKLSDVYRRVEFEEEGENS